MTLSNISLTEETPNASPLSCTPNETTRQHSKHPTLASLMLWLVGYRPFEIDTSMDVGWRVGGAAPGREGEGANIVRVSPDGGRAATSEHESAVRGSDRLVPRIDHLRGGACREHNRSAPLLNMIQLVPIE